MASAAAFQNGGCEKFGLSVIGPEDNEGEDVEVPF